MVAGAWIVWKSYLFVSYFTEAIFCYVQPIPEAEGVPVVDHGFLTVWGLEALGLRAGLQPVPVPGVFWVNSGAED